MCTGTLCTRMFYAYNVMSLYILYVYVFNSFQVYDWCMYMVLSKEYVPSASTVKNRLASVCDDFGPLYRFDAESGTKVTLTSDMKTHMRTFYELVLKFKIIHFEEKVKEKIRFHSDEKKTIFTKCGHIKEWKFGEVVLSIRQQLVWKHSHSL